MFLNFRRFLILAALLCAAPCLFAQAPAPHVLEGTFNGTLQAGDAQLHLVLHLSRSASGGMRASLDSLDQAVYGIEASDVTLAASVFKLSVPSVGARFEGKVSSDLQFIDGNWTQGSVSLPLSFRRVDPKAAARKPADAVAPVEGVWQTALDTHGLRLRYQLHLSHDAEGHLVGSLDSLDQGVSGLPATELSYKNHTLHFEVPSVSGVFEGTYDAAKNSLSGSWEQSGAEAELTFHRSDQPLERRRPQEPAPPLSYPVEDVSFPGAPGVTLAGTLTLPHGSGPFPAAILIAGSGLTDRDESNAGHKPFLVLSDFLTRKGIAVLRYDKRGVGKSTGTPATATTLDFAADASAAVAFLKSRKDIDPARLGLIGHSEGAMIAPYIANHSKDVAWVVLLAPPAAKGEDILLKQSELIARAGGLSEKQLEASTTFDRTAYAILRKETDPAAAAAKLRELISQSGMDAALPPDAIQAQVAMLTSPWFRFFIDYDPVPELAALKTPVLALYGQYDLQVPPAANLPIAKKSFEASGNPDATVQELPGLNHLFQHAYTGSPAEYPAIEETFSPDAMTLIADWILSRHS